MTEVLTELDWDRYEQELKGEQSPRLWTAPPRHIEPAETCKSCGKPRYPDKGCGDQLSTEVLQWAKGIGYDLDPWQSWSIAQGMGTRPNGRWASKENCLIVSRQNGKGDCALSEPVYTTSRGWQTHSTVVPGDWVLGSDGKPVEVLAVSPVFVNRDCFRVTFSDGSSVVASQYHLWRVRAAHGNRAWQDVSTEDLAKSTGKRRADNGRMEYNWRARCDAVPELPDADLPIDPYLLGYWLGDGTCSASAITIGKEDLAWATERLYRAGARKPGWDNFGERPVPVAKDGTAFTLRFRIDAAMRDGFESRLRKLSLWKNKRIPEDYLTASVTQRKALLAGLMDSDGSVTRNNKTPQAEFCTVLPELASGFHRLCRSLGIRVKPVTHKSAGRDRIRFLFTSPFNPFELPRKAECWKAPASSRHELMSVVSVTRVQSVPTRCIKVAAEDGVYLTGRHFTPTHNTILEVRELAGLYLLREPLIIHTAHLLVTAQEHFLRLIETIDNNPSLSRQVKGRPRLANGQESITLKAKPTLIFGPGNTRIRRRGTVRLKFLARAGKGSARGLSCDCLVFDEAMILPTELVGAALPTLSARANPQVWYAGSAGMEDSFQLSKLRTRIVKDTKNLFGAEWSAPMHKETCPRDELRGRRDNDFVVNCDRHRDRDDPRTWAIANPALGKRLTIDWIRTAELGSMDLVEFNRERCGEGQWPTEEAAWKVVAEDLWETLAVPLGTRARPFAFGLDVTEDGGAATISAAWVLGKGPSRKIVMEVPRGCSRPGTGWVLTRLIELDKKWKPIAIVVPRSGPAAGLGDDIEKQWPDSSKWGTKVHRATVADEAAAFAWFVQQCKDRRKPLVHPVQEKAAALYNAVGTAETRVVGDGGKTWSRRDSETDITAATSANLAAWGLNKKLRETNPLSGIA